MRPPICYDHAVQDSVLVPLDDGDWEIDLQAWQAECDASRAAAASERGAPGEPERERRAGEELQRLDVLPMTKFDPAPMLCSAV